MCFWGKVYDSLKGDKRHVFENRGPIVGCSSSAVVPCWGCCCVMADCVCVCVRLCAYGKGEGGRGSQSLPFQTVSLCQTWLRLWHNTAQRGPLFVWVCAFYSVSIISGNPASSRWLMLCLWLFLSSSLDSRA